MPISAVDEIVEHWLAACDCGHVFSQADQISDGAPARPQVEALPVMAVRVTEHQYHHVRCPGCGTRRRGQLPPEVTGSAFGPRLQAVIVTLSVRNRISRRDVVELCEQLFAARIATGTVDRVLARAADALTLPCEDLLDRVRAADAVNMDETGWRLRGKQRALWGMFTDRHAILTVAPGRHQEHPKDLLATSTAIVTSDRWWAYNHLPVKQRQVCWSHLQRDFAFHAEGLDADWQLGAHGSRICGELFGAWETFQRTGDRRELKRRIRLLRPS